VNLLVKIVNTVWKEENISKRDIKDSLKDVGLEDIAEQVSKRIDDHAHDGWTADQLREQVDAEPFQMEKEIELSA
jgi:hypothetical protein